MKAVIQRVSQSRITINHGQQKDLSRGLVVLVAVGLSDTEQDAIWLAQKITGLRIFPNDEGKLDLSVADIKGEILAVSQFTLYGDCRKGRRPDFTQAARPEQAIALYRKFLEVLASSGVPVATGEFGADMQVDIHNDGPVTIIIDSREDA